MTATGRAAGGDGAEVTDAGQTSDGDGFYGGPIRTTWRIFGSRRSELTLAIALRLVQAMFAGLPVATVAWIVEQIRQDSFEPGDAWLAVAVVTGSVIGQYVFALASNRYAWVSTFEVIGEARTRALAHVQRLPIGVLSSKRTGDVSAVLTSDYEMVSTFASSSLPVLYGAIGLPVGVLFGLIFVDVALTLAVAISIVVAVPTFLLVNARFAVAARERADLLAVANTRVVEYVQGISEARAYNQVGRQLASFRDAVGDVRRINDATAVKLVPMAFVAIGIVMVGVPISIAAVGYRALGGPVDIGTGVIFLVLVLQVYAPLVQVGVQVENLRLGDAALQQIGDVMDLEPQQQPSEIVSEPTSADVVFDGVVFGYEPDVPVLDDISLRASAGTMTALVGASGTGKTTILNLIARFWDPTDGVVRIGGVDVRDLTADQLFDAVTVVFQDVYLFQGTIHDNIAFGRPGATDDEIEAAAAAAQAHDFITALPDGYDTRVGEGGATLSGGERQRVSIARAILKDAPIVLLDEPSASVDPLNERAIHQALTALVRDKTLIVVAHRLSTIRSANQIIVLARDGAGPSRIAERGGHEELLALDGVYANQWRERTRAAEWRVRTRTRRPPPGR
ncbi:MAG: ABC transporter ATP-binding protein [Actinomycetota bacterium]